MKKTYMKPELKVVEVANANILSSSELGISNVEASSFDMARRGRRGRSTDFFDDED